MTGGSDYMLRLDVENAGFERIRKEVLSTLLSVLRTFELLDPGRPGSSARGRRVGA